MANCRRTGKPTTSERWLPRRWNGSRASFKPATWEAFLLTAVEGRPPAQVAARVGLSVGAIYVAKSRVIARLRQEIERMQGDEP